MLFELAAAGLILAFELCLAFELFLPCGQFDFLGAVLRFERRILAQLVSFSLCLRQDIPAGELKQGKQPASADDQPDENSAQ